MKTKIKGTGVALVTPFKNNQIDFEALALIIEHCISGGVNFLVALGTTAETPTLSLEEQDAILDFVIEKINGRLPLVAGFASNDTNDLCQQIKTRNFNGIDAILSASPYYNKPSQEGIYRHFRKVEEVSPVPIILYNVPARTASNISATTTIRLAESSTKFIAIKEASFDIAQCMQIIHDMPEHFSVLSGDDKFTLPLISIGGSGVISVLGNAFPKPFSTLVNHALSSEFNKAAYLHYELLSMMDLLFKEGNPAGIKAALHALNLCENELRLPLVELSNQTNAEIRNEIQYLKNQYII